MFRIDVPHQISSVICHGLLAVEPFGLPDERPVLQKLIAVRLADLSSCVYVRRRFVENAEGKEVVVLQFVSGLCTDEKSKVGVVLCSPVSNASGDRAPCL